MHDREQVSPALRAMMRAAEQQHMAEHAIDPAKATRVIHDPAEVQEQRLKYVGKMNWQAAGPFFPRPSMSIRARARMNGAPAAHHAILVAETYLEWLRGKV